MEDKSTNHDFLVYAEQQLEAHIEELNKTYEGREMPSNEEKSKAFETRFNMFTAQLNEKSKELCIEPESEKIIEEYQQKFKERLPK